MAETAEFTPRAIVKLACPFSLKFRIFAEEAGVADRFRYEVVSEGTDAYDEAKAEMKKAGVEASFPTVEIAPGQYLGDSDTLIDHYCEAFGIDRNSLELLQYYKSGVFDLAVSLYQENKELKEKADAA